MNEIWTLTRRELKSYFDSPSAYVVLIVFLLITGWYFATPLFVDNTASLRSVFQIVPFIFLFFVPAVTMSTFAEERRSGTLELLLTMPIRDWQVIAGKMLAVVLFLGSAIALTFVYAISISLMGDLDLGSTVGGYLGLLLLALTFGSIGMLASSLTRNQIVAFILAFGMVFLLYLLDKITAFVPSGLGSVLQYLGVDTHFQNLLRGVIDTRDVLYYLSVSFFALLLTAYHLSRRPD